MSDATPRLGRRLLSVMLPRELREETAADLADLHAARTARSGRRAADRRYWRELPGVAVRLRLASLLGALRSETPVPRADRSTRREPMSNLLHDLRQSARSLLRTRRFTTVAILTLALGIGANTAIFSVIRSVLLRPLPFPDAERIVGLWETRLERGWDQSSFTHANFWDVHDQNHTFETMGAARNTTFNLTGLESPERLSGARVTAGFFRAS